MACFNLRNDYIGSLFAYKEMKSAFLKGIKEGFKDFSNLIVLVVNTVLLSVVYFIGVGLTSIFAKIAKKSFLDIKKTERETYWKDLDLKDESIDKYYRQF